ncbi:MAG TPA: response regulator [Geobacteraceae bacterium]|nr:response regulator [Geobacteraceae bacterium]
MSNKLLLADDSITIRKVVGIIFANEDYSLSVVDNGNAALEKAREIMPDIILADVIMPGKTGYEVCAEIRSDPLLSHVPLLLLTGAFEPFDEEKARQSGADDFISKPFESLQLLEKVERLIELGKERKAAQPPQAPEAKVQEVLQAPFAAPHAAASIAWEVPLEEEVVEEQAFLIEELSAEEEIFEALAEDDLWGTFELEEAAEGEPAEFESVLEEEIVDPFGKFEIVEEPSLIEEEITALPDTAPESAGAPPEEPGAALEPVGEETFTLGEETGAGAFEIVSEEVPFGIAVEEEPSIIEAAMGRYLELGANAEERKPDLSYLGEQPPTELRKAADDQKPDLSYLFEPYPTAKPTVPEVELQFAPEEEYIPIPPVEPPPSIPAAAPVELAAPPTAPPAVYGEPVLSDEQLAAIIAKISREIIEKIAWEVVPDLAEMLIREEIRKIKQGTQE